MIESLSRLISIPSVAVPDGSMEHPFGEHVHEAFTTMLHMGDEAEFLTWNADNFGGHIDFPGTGDGMLGIVGHLDVVPEGDGWEFDPYGGEVIDGYVCGRGASDDKGPVIASFYAMKALKDLGFAPDKTVRLILGLDEETNWKGMEHYLAFVDRTPDLGFSPDADFPVIHGEMGMLVFDLARKFGRFSGKGLELRTIKGGTAANAVPDFARAVVMDTSGGGYESIRNLVAELRESRGWRLQCKGVGKSLEITAEGTSAHGSKPEEGENAISIIMELLGHLNFVSDDQSAFVQFYNEHIGFDMHGEHIGCAFEDEPSGKLIWNTGMIDLDQKSVRLTINVRYPVTGDCEQVYDGVMSVIDPFDLGIIKDRHKAPIYLEEDDPLVTTLMDIYRRQTGDEESKPLVIGGGTYARALENTVAFGARFPGEPGLEHMRDEKISVEGLMKLAHIYAEAIYELSRGEHD